jgi:murein DD-endopeptidase MepM/ murein hydrolase activator NlpD
LALARQIGAEQTRLSEGGAIGPSGAIADAGVISSGETTIRAGAGEAPALDFNQFSTTFKTAKGSLPWPVEKGVITTKFGVQVHPVFNTRVQNLGVDISADAGSAVRVVNDGVVYAVQPMQGYGDVIFINHGDYKTAYGNLSSVLVSRNQVVKRGDILGLSGTKESVRGEVLFFLVREGTQNVNPVGWLSPSAK